jgi:hypothetical protein
MYHKAMEEYVLMIFILIYWLVVWNINFIFPNS